MANLEIEIGAVTSGLDKSLKAAESKLASFSQKATSIGKNLSIAVTAPILAIGAAAIKSASDTEESFSKFDTVFRDVAKGAETSFQTLRKEYGLSSLAAKTLLGDTGDLLTGFGFSQEAALDLSTEVNKLAVDLASFTNFSGGAQGASEALTKALLGERESVKALGIAILEEDVQKQIAINTARGLTFETERQAKAQATLDLAIQQSQNAIGDYARTSDSFANQTRLLQARLSDLGAELGQVLLPLATKITRGVSAVVESFSNLSRTTKVVIVAVAGLAAAIGPLLLSIGGIIAILPAIKAGALAISATFTPLVIKIIAVTAAVAGLAVIAKGLIDSWDTVTAFFSQLWDKVKIIFLDGVTAVLKQFNKLTSVIGLDFKDTIDGLEAESERIKGVLDSKPVVTFGDVFKEIGTNIKSTFTGIKDDITSSMSAAKSSIEGTGKSLKQLTLEEFKEIATIKNEEVFAKFASDAEQYNKKLRESIDLQNRLLAAGRNIGQPTQIVDVGVNLGGAPVLEVPEIDESSKSKFLSSLTQFKENISQILTSGVSNVIGDFAFSIGEALGSGANIVESVGATLLQGIAEIANQLGQAAIGIGVSMIAIKKAFTNPFTAIAAGAALVALAGVISSQVPKITQGGGGAGGVTGGAGQSFQGSGANNALVDSFGALEITGESKIQGTDIIISYEKAQRANGR